MFALEVMVSFFYNKNLLELLDWRLNYSWFLRVIMFDGNMTGRNKSLKIYFYLPKIFLKTIATVQWTLFFSYVVVKHMLISNIEIMGVWNLVFATFAIVWGCCLRPDVHVLTPFAIWFCLRKWN